MLHRKLKSMPEKPQNDTTVQGGVSTHAMAA